VTYKSRNFKLLVSSSRHVSYFWPNNPQWAMTSFTGFLDHTKQRTTVSKAPVDEWSARCRDLYVTTQDTHNRQTSMTPVGFESTISAGEQPQTYALHGAATRNGFRSYYRYVVRIMKDKEALGYVCKQ